jgi:hypothetical protein
MTLLDILWRHMKLQVLYSSAAEQNPFTKKNLQQQQLVTL